MTLSSSGCLPSDLFRGSRGSSHPRTPEQAVGWMVGPSPTMTNSIRCECATTLRGRLQSHALRHRQRRVGALQVLYGGEQQVGVTDVLHAVHQVLALAIGQVLGVTREVRRL